jgi:Mn2+/Fe2+ NRAMP family transporter
MVLMMLLVARRRVMGDLVASRRLRIAGWLCTGVMALAVGAMFATMGK